MCLFKDLREDGRGVLVNKRAIQLRSSSGSFPKATIHSLEVGQQPLHDT